MMKLVLLSVFTCFMGLSIICLNHGRDAKLGELPYIVRIIVSEDVSNTSSEVDAAIVATGVLITSTRILTTCDSVGSFTGQNVILYDISRVSIMAGSVSSGGEGGEMKKPNFISAHPYCYSVMATRIILFNYGIYTISEPFNQRFGIATMVRTIENQRNMEVALRKMWEGKTSVTCVTAGWGNPRKQFEGDGMPDTFERFSKILQTTTMEIVDYPTCYRTTCKYFDDCLLSIWEYGFVCATAKDGGPCQEDNGAPLVCSGQLFAIHTFPQKCEDEGLPRHFQRIDLAFGYVYGVPDNADAHKADGFGVIVSLLLTFWKYYSCEIA